MEIKMKFREILKEELMFGAVPEILEKLERTVSRTRFYNVYSSEVGPETLVAHYREKGKRQYLEPTFGLKYNKKDNSAKVYLKTITWDKNAHNVYLNLEETIDFIENIEDPTDRADNENLFKETLKQFKKIFDPKKNMGLKIVKDPSDKFGITSSKEFEKYI